MKILIATLLTLALATPGYAMMSKDTKYMGCLQIAAQNAKMMGWKTNDPAYVAEACACHLKYNPKSPIIQTLGCTN